MPPPRVPMQKAPIPKIVRQKAAKQVMPKGNFPAGATTEALICSVLRARALTDLQTPPSSVITVNLADLAGSFSAVEFFAVDEAKREILAVALAAISTQSNVEAIVDTPTGTGDPQIYSLSIIAA